jgi:hypothetical protein
MHPAKCRLIFIFLRILESEKLSVFSEKQKVLQKSRTSFNTFCGD